jgi:hypothetical protein
MILRTIEKLFGRIGDQGKKSIFEYSLSWYTGEKQCLSSASAQVLIWWHRYILPNRQIVNFAWYCTVTSDVFLTLTNESCALQVIDLVVGDCTLRTSKHLKSILAVAKKIMESSVTASGGMQLGVTDETVLPFWKEAYHCSYDGKVASTLSQIICWAEYGDTVCLCLSITAKSNCSYSFPWFGSYLNFKVAYFTLLLHFPWIIKHETDQIQNKMLYRQINTWNFTNPV